MLRLEEISISYPRVKVLHKISLEFQRREFTVILGASGSGKSTLLRCMNLLKSPDRGKLFTEDLGDLSDDRLIHEHRKRTAFIFQHHQLIGRTTAFSNVLIGRLGHHSTIRTLFPLQRNERRIGLEALTRVDLLHKASERVDNLSGGEQQRVGIARALAQRPRLILADEPVSSLDPATADKVTGLIRRICNEDRITTVVSLHQVDLARKYADRVIGLAQGRVVFDGSPADLSNSVLDLIYSSSKPFDASTTCPSENTLPSDYAVMEN
jgi:phosphonate transport system ATP-binding protein